MNPPSAKVPPEVVEKMRDLYAQQLQAIKHQDTRRERIKHGCLLKMLDDYRSAIIDDLLELGRVNGRMGA